MGMNMGKTLGEILSTNPLKFEIIYRIHATKRMFQRSISEEEAEGILCDGCVIEIIPMIIHFRAFSSMGGQQQIGIYIALPESILKTGGFI